MEDKIYELVRKLYFGSSYEEIVNALKCTLEYFDNEADVYKKRCIVKYWGDKFGSFVVSKMFNRLSDNEYNIFDNSKSAMMNAAYYFSGLKDIRDFKVMAKEIIKIYDTELATDGYKLITLAEVNDAIKIAKEKVNVFQTLNLKIQLYIFLHDRKNLNFNSYVIPTMSEKVKRYFINCFKMQSENTHPVYVFFHELGHILLCELLGSEKELPYSFYSLAKKIMNIDMIDSKDKMIELFCELFAATMMIDTKYEKYSPYRLDKCEKQALLKYFKSLENHIDKFECYYDLARYYQSLKSRVNKGESLSLKDITDEQFRQLAVTESVVQSVLDMIFVENQDKIVREREKRIGYIQIEYYDFERVVKLYMAGCGYLSSIQILKLLKSQRVREVYEINYQNKMEYKRKFYIAEEIAKQEEIVVYNEEHPDNPKTSLDDEFKRIIGRMYKRGEITEPFLENTYNLEIFPDKDKIEEFIDSISKEVETENSVFVKLENFKNHESKETKTKRAGGKRDYLKQYINQQTSGTSGEDFAYEQEKIRLKDYPHLVDKIIPYYKDEPLKGYDILSFETDGREKYIEVKSSSTNNSDKKIHFFISDNEDEFLSKNPNACIYYVYNFKNKKIREIKREQYLEMKKIPRLYEVDIDCE